MIWFIFINGILAYVGELVFKTNMPLFHLYILVEAIILMKVFAVLLHPFISSRIVHVAIVSFILLWAFNIFFGDGIMGYPTYILAIEGPMLIILAVGWFVKVQREKKVQHPERLFAFWLSTGVLIFFSGNMLLFTYSNFIFAQRQHVFIAIWDTHAILVILLYLIYTIAIIWARKNPTSS